MLETTVGQLLVNQALPEDLRDYNRVLDKKGVTALYRQLAVQHPEKYREVAKALSDVARHESQRFGGFSFGLTHLQKSRAAVDYRNQLTSKLAQLINDDRLTDKQREEAVVKLTGSGMGQQQDTIYDEGVANNNPLAMQVKSGTKGSKMNLSSIHGSDMLYVDHHNNVVPVPVLRSYAEGLTPWEYWAGSYGARKGVLDVKQSTANAGYLGKVMNQVSHRLVISDLDGDGEPDTVRGLPVDTDDSDNEGALLAKDVGPYKRNTVLTPKILKHIAQLGSKRILVRSPTVGGSPDGGVYSRDAGVRESGMLPGLGENPGMAAAQALAEPISQGSLSSKHSGGVVGQAKAVSGFDYIESQVQVPKHIKGGATHSEADGVVGKIEVAPAGGHFVYVNGEQHYVPEDNPLLVKPGDRVEAGDVLSEGVPNPSHIVRHKGIGEGRRYFVKSFQKAMESGGLRANRRNVELLARGLINHVRLNDEMSQYAPDDVVSYSTMEHLYHPRPEAQTLKPSLAAGRYLEKPVLHYTIGTPLRPSVIKELDEFGIKDVTVHNDPPPFEPEMLRGMDNLAQDPDWQTRMYGSGLKKSLLRGTARGAVSDTAGSSFVPSLAQAVNFGRGGVVQKPQPGWKVDLDSGQIKTSAVPATMPSVPGDGKGLDLGKPEAAAIKPQNGTGVWGLHGGSEQYGNTSPLLQAAMPYLGFAGPLAPYLFAGMAAPKQLSTLMGGPSKTPAAAPTTAPAATPKPATTQPVAPQASQPVSPLVQHPAQPNQWRAPMLTPKQQEQKYNTTAAAYNSAYRAAQPLLGWRDVPSQAEQYVAELSPQVKRDLLAGDAKPVGIYDSYVHPTAKATFATAAANDLAKGTYNLARLPYRLIRPAAKAAPEIAKATRFGKLLGVTGRVSSTLSRWAPAIGAAVSIGDSGLGYSRYGVQAAEANTAANRIAGAEEWWNPIDKLNYKVLGKDDVDKRNQRFDGAGADIYDYLGALRNGNWTKYRQARQAMNNDPAIRKNLYDFGTDAAFYNPIRSIGTGLHGSKALEQSVTRAQQSVQQAQNMQLDLQSRINHPNSVNVPVTYRGPRKLELVRNSEDDTPLGLTNFSSLQGDAHMGGFRWRDPITGKRYRPDDPVVVEYQRRVLGYDV